VSKREDDLPADMEAGMTTAERRRRRRRGGGLRVPSDNVPRRTGSHPAVTVPVPEDPNLGVSIAYNFSTEASGPVPREEIDSQPVMNADAVPSAGPVPVPSPAESARRTPSVPPPFRSERERPEAPERIDVDADQHSAAGIRLDSSPEIALDAIVSVEAVDGADVVEPLDAVPSDAVSLEPEPADGTPAPIEDVLGGGRTREMPAVNLEALGLSIDDSEPEITEFTPPPATRGAPTASSDEDEAENEKTGERPLGDRSGAHALATASGTIETADAVPAAVDGDVPVEASVDIEMSEMEEEPESVPIQRAYRRTTTVALSEEDLEELMDAEASGDRAASPMALGDEDLADEVQTPADAADSGEILSEDLIEEVDNQNKAAAAAQSRAAAPAPAVQVAAAPAPAVAATPAAPAAPVAKTRARTADGVSGEGNGADGATRSPPPAPKKEKNAQRAAAVAAAVQPGDAQSKKKKKGKPWFEEIFDEDYLRTLPFLTPQATQAEARFVIESLGIEAGAQVLDLGCGYGRHAMELAARGYHVVGLDQSLPLLLRGADEAQRRGLTINFMHGDMRELDIDAQFDGAYCLFSTFGYFDDETNKKTAQNLARALKPGAKAVIEVLNRDYLIGDLPTRVWWEGDGCVVLEEVDFNYFSSRVQSARSVVFDDGRQLEQEISIRAYSLHELGKLLHAVGFRVIEVSGSIQTRGRFFGHHSRQIIIVAERRAPGKDTIESTRA